MPTVHQLLPHKRCHGRGDREQTEVGPASVLVRAPLGGSPSPSGHMQQQLFCALCRTRRAHAAPLLFPAHTTASLNGCLHGPCPLLASTLVLYGTVRYCSRLLYASRLRSPSSCSGRLLPTVSRTPPEQTISVARSGAGWNSSNHKRLENEPVVLCLAAFGAQPKAPPPRRLLRPAFAATTGRIAYCNVSADRPNRHRCEGGHCALDCMPSLEVIPDTLGSDRTRFTNGESRRGTFSTPRGPRVRGDVEPTWHSLSLARGSARRRFAGRKLPSRNSSPGCSPSAPLTIFVRSDLYPSD